jgi:multidrug resistance efflux pump
MRYKFIIPFILVLALAACVGGSNAPTAIPTIMLGGNTPTDVPGIGATTGNNGGVTASGVIVADHVARMAFSIPGNIKSVNVAVGDRVETGQVLVELEDSAQQIALEQANMALDALTTPEAVADARIAVTTAQKNVTDAQYALDNQLYWKNTGLIQDQYSNVVIAKANLDKAQRAYDHANVGDYINNTGEAALYQALYDAQQAYDNAQFYYSLYSQQPTERQMNEVQAKLDLANATLKNAQDYLGVLTGGEVPQDASGNALAVYRQAKLAVQSAQDNLDATKLVAPFSGEVASVSVSKGDFAAPGQVLLVFSDVDHMHVETTDLSERDVPGVKAGQPVTISIKALNQNVQGTVKAISPLAQTLGGDVVYTAIINLASLPESALAGMSVDVQFLAEP